MISQGQSPRHRVQFSALRDASQYHAEAPCPNYRSIWSAICLVSGTAVGAGILAIPSASQKSGFIPSSLTLFAAWILMTTCGFLISELSCNIARIDRSTKNLGIIAMTERLFGEHCGKCVGLLYILFHYTLLVAYIAESGTVITNATHMPLTASVLLYAFILGGATAILPANIVEMLNDSFFSLVLVTFFGLVCIGLGAVKGSNLVYQDYSAVGRTVPLFMIALIFHNIIPTICGTLLYHRRSIFLVLIVGSLIPLSMFIIWNAVILGMVSNYAEVAAGDSLIDPLDILLSSHNAGNYKLAGKALVSLFSIGAISTSFIGFVCSQMECFSGFFPSRTKRDPLLYVLVLVPPALIAVGDPAVFFLALDAAGTYGVSILFGILPTLLTWKLRLSKFAS
jgi:tyrosine-specific transport protein